MAMIPEYKNSFQDPFLPLGTPRGPSFVDSEACLCALRPIASETDTNIAWQCIGSQADGVYLTRNGKWFNTVQNGIKLPVTRSLDDDSKPLNATKAFVYADRVKRLVPYDSSNSTLSIYNRACTGVNQTTFTASFYRSVHQITHNETAVDAAPCWQVGAVPIQIQTATSWQDKGCLSGFYCPNNTVNSLPQYCPPPKDCQVLRLAGGSCYDVDGDSLNIGMGPFEPVVCDKGYYCPEGGEREDQMSKRYILPAWCGYANTLFNGKYLP